MNLLCHWRGREGRGREERGGRGGMTVIDILMTPQLFKLQYRQRIT